MGRRSFGEKARQDGTRGRWLRPVLLASLALAACHAPGGGLSIAQTASRWEGLPVREAQSTAYALTLYADGWGLVNETGRLELTPTEQIVAFSPVAAQTEPRGAYLQIPGTVSDRRFRYDLQSRERLMERYHGRTVEIVTATGSISAVLLVTETGPVFRIGDRLTSDPGGRVVYPPLPDLAVEPRLEWVVSVSAPWSGTATASYIVNRLGWQNEYTLRTDADQTRGEWTQWAALSNQSGGRFPDAQVTLVAGDVRREDRFPPVPLAYGGKRAYAEIAPAEPFAARYQYRLPERITLERNAEPRISMARADGVPLTRIFRIMSMVDLYRSIEPELPRKATIRLTIPNTEAANLGKPLPRGKVTVYTPNRQGEQAVAGEPMIPDTPRGQTIILELGEAFDVTAQRTQTKLEVTSDGSRVGYSITLRNQMDRAVPVEVIEQIPGDWTVLSNSHPYDRLSASELRFRPTVPAGGEVKVTYEVRVRTQLPPSPVPPPAPR
ncbi:hypothetical protein D3C86_355350 [compost metagenome]